MSPLAEQISAALLASPFYGRVFLVGGSVRDDLLGLPNEGDLDLVVEGDALEAAQILWEKRLAQGPPQVFSRFGTAMVMIEGRQIELASARSESYSPDSRKPVTQTASLEEDALRRDFTINTLLRDLWTGEVRDILGTGLSDPTPPENA
jgi:poly(A) polymerase